MLLGVGLGGLTRAALSHSCWCVFCSCSGCLSVLWVMAGPQFELSVVVHILSEAPLPSHVPRWSVAARLAWLWHVRSCSVFCYFNPAPSGAWFFIIYPSARTRIIVEPTVPTCSTIVWVTHTRQAGGCRWCLSASAYVGTLYVKQGCTAGLTLILLLPLVMATGAGYSLH